MGTSFSAAEGGMNVTTLVRDESNLFIKTNVPLDGNDITVGTQDTHPPLTPASGYSYEPSSSVTDFSNRSSTDDLSRQSSIDFNNSSNDTNTTNSTSLFNATSLSNDFSFNMFGTDWYPFKWLTLPTLFSWLGPLSSLAMIIGCVMPYVPQYTTIYKRNDSGGFSTFVCFTLLIANILRVAFWYGHPFELPLLIQSLVQIVAQLLLLELCVRVKWHNSEKLWRRKFFTSPTHFWRWNDILSYIEFLLLFTAILGASMYFLKDCQPFVETIGYCALVLESMLGLPQVIKNYKNKSVEGMSLGMVFMWLAGDSFKTGYFIVNNVPFQFWLCGLSQITIDLLILFQVCLFRQNAPVKKNFRGDDPADIAL